MEDRTVSRTSPATRPTRRRPRRWLGPAAWGTFAVAAGVAGYFLLRPQPVVVEVATVARKPIEASISQSGRTRLRNPYVVAAPVAGKMLRVPWRAGDRVEQGQVLATIMPLDSPLLDGRSSSETEARVTAASIAVMRAKALVTGAKAAHELAQREVTRQRTLFQQNVSSAAELERAEMEERARASELSVAELGVQVAWSEAAVVRATSERSPPPRGGDTAVLVRAPISGFVTQVYHENEGPIAMGTSIVQIGDPSDLEVVVQVLTTQAVSIEVGAPATISGWGGDDLLGRVRTVVPSALTKVSALGIEEQRVPVIIDFSREPSQRLGDGFAVEVSIVTRHEDDAVVLPVGALHANGDSYGTFVVDDTGIAHERAVDVLMMNPRDAATLEGVRPGDRVILHPTDRVRDRVRVRVRD